MRAFAVMALAGALAIGVAGSAAAQESTTTTETSTSSSELTTTTLAPTDGDGDDGVSTGTWVLLITGGLLVAALLLSAFTWRYWRATKPGSGSEGVAAGEDEADVVPRPERRSAPTV